MTGPGAGRFKRAREDLADELAEQKQENAADHGSVLRARGRGVNAAWGGGL